MSPEFTKSGVTISRYYVPVHRSTTYDTYVSFVRTKMWSLLFASRATYSSLLRRLAQFTSLAMPFRKWDGLDWGGEQEPDDERLPLTKWDGLDWGGQKTTATTCLPMRVRTIFGHICSPCRLPERTVHGDGVVRSEMGWARLGLLIWRAHVFASRSLSLIENDPQPSPS